jgi:alkanesulfonate monooxygenase SsuD/methylene tetrahydromethanopterin reductase-like flavin-dependent oxidoreductase (luciferase family)
VALNPERLAAGREHLRREFEKAGRDPDTADVTVFVSRTDQDTIQQYQTAGANRLVFTMGSMPDANPFERLDTLAVAAGL